MFVQSYLKVPDRGPEPILALPIGVRLWLVPDEHATAPVNIVRIARSLLSDDGWHRTPDIFDIEILAPHWDEKRLREFVERPISQGHLGADEFHLSAPKLRALQAPAPARRPRHIVYTNALLSDLDRDTGIDADLARDQTRLLIVHYDLGTPNAVAPDARLEQFGAARVRAGLPAFLAVGTANAQAAERYFHDLFAGITHDWTLQQFANPSSNDVIAALTARESAGSILSLQPYMDELDSSLGKKLEHAEQQRHRLNQRRRFLHARDASSLAKGIELAAKPLAGQRDEIMRIRSSNMVLESYGIAPLHAVAQAAEAAPDAPDVEEEAFEDQPRVLNAAIQSGQSDVDPAQALVPAAEYVLAVQIGPRWTNRATLVTGSANFPEEALADGSAGHVLDVVFVSEDIAPSLVETQLWLPRSGASAPFSDGEAGPEGPSLLPFQTVAPRPDASGTFEGRLSIYFKNTVLQSATLRGALVPADTPPPRRLELTVDYAVTGSFADIAALEMRELRNANGEAEKLPVGLALLKNGGDTRHRIIAKGTAVPAKWRSYDPQGNTAALTLARDALVARFSQQGLDRDVNAYRDDLDALATAGSALYSKAFGQVDGSSDPDFVAYLRTLADAIRSKTVIQIATSGLTQYVFPWALLYDYPMDRPDTRRYCDLVTKGEYTGPPQARCPYDDQDWHEANVLCPYGFWGFRHIVEQPLSALPPGQTDVLEWGLRRQPEPAGSSVVFTTGVTRDPAIANAVDAHLQNLATLGAVTPAGGGVQWSVMEQNLRASEMLYFLCHGRHDDSRNESYIAIGATGATSDERIYPSALLAWALKRSNLVPALRKAPLVIINGCHTAALTADDLVSFVQNYASLGASGVIGTEVSVPVDFAAGFAFALLAKITTGKSSVGQAVYDTRWDFARRGNLLGLIYTPYCFADLAVFS